MPQFFKANLRIIVIVGVLILLSCSGIWSVPYYVNQDGIPHLYNAFLIRELVKGNPEISQFVSLNPSLIPNLTGHWILAFLLTIFDPAITTKLFVTLLFVGLALSSFWLRRQVAGYEDSLTALLLSFVLSFNWMWFLGFYNFILGAIGFTFTLGLWWRWRANLTLGRSLVIFALILFVFFSHLISFVILIGILLFLTLTNWGADYFKNTVIWTLVAVVLTLPFFFNYLILSRSKAGLSPNWGYLENPLSISNWILHLRSADPFQLISRKTIPFFTETSSIFGIFSSSIWLVAALFLLTMATAVFWNIQKSDENKASRIWFIISSSLCVLWFIAPDDFGKSHGAFLRERILLLGLICFVPVFRLADSRRLKIGAQSCLLFVFIFQSLVVWDYSLNSNAVVREVLEARDYIGDEQALGSIILNRDGCQFKPIPRSNLSVFIAIDKNTKVWDNYEIGYYLFPVVARSPEDRQFVFDFRESNTFDFCDPQEQFERKFQKLSALLEDNHKKFDVLLVWGRDERIELLIKQWFEEKPYFENGYIRLFHSRIPGKL